ncbi:MAG: heme exporter protein CcmB, partial [Pseudomonadota bacterium]
MATAFVAQTRRDLKLSLRRYGDMANPLMFFAIITALFPLAISPEPAILRAIAPGVVWVAALLAALLGFAGLFRGDFDDGTLEQMALSPQPLAVLTLGRTFAQWLVTGLPIVLISPLAAVGLHLPASAMPTMMLSLALGTPVLALVTTVADALTVSLNRGGLLLSILVLPLIVPVLVFGARATDMAANGDDTTGPLYLMAALLLVSVSLT